MNARVGFVPGQTKRQYQGLPLLLLAGLFALLIGAVTAFGNLLASAMMVAILGSLALTGFPRLLFWFSVVGSLVLSGLFELYLPGLQTLRWAFAGCTALFFVSVVLHDAWSPQQERQPLNSLTITCTLYLAICAISLFANWHGASNAVLGLKNYFQALGLLLGLALMARWDGLERNLTRAMLAIGLLQLPFALHQFLVVAPKRVGMGPQIVPVDIVAGTFGANFMGGGNNSVLAMFLVIVAAMMLSLWRKGALPGRWLWLLAPLLSPIFLNESKVALVYLVLAFIVIFRTEILRRPVRFLSLSVVLAMLGTGLLFSYVAVQRASEYKTPAEMVEHFVRQNTREGERYGTLALNRTTSLTHWFKSQRRYTLSQTLFGHGLSASRDDSSGVLTASRNLANTAYPGMGIGLTTVSSMLWDIGVVGLVTVLAMFASAFFLAGRLARRHAASAYKSGLFLGLQASVAIFVLSLIHKNFFTFQLGYQVMIFLIFGYLIYASKHLAVDEPAGASPPQAGPTC
jgi:hypothetical protein